MSNVITDVNVFLPNEKAPKAIKANGTFTVSGAFKVKFTLWEGARGMWVQLPAQKSEKVNPETGKSDYYPYVSAISKEVEAELNKAVLDAYAKKTGKKVTNELSQGQAAGPASQVDPYTDNVPF